MVAREIVGEHRTWCLWSVPTAAQSLSNYTAPLPSPDLCSCSHPGQIKVERHPRGSKENQRQVLQAQVLNKASAHVNTVHRPGCRVQHNVKVHLLDLVDKPSPVQQLQRCLRQKIHDLGLACIQLQQRCGAFGRQGLRQRRGCQPDFRSPDPALDPVLSQYVALDRASLYNVAPEDGTDGG